MNFVKKTNFFIILPKKRWLFLSLLSIPIKDHERAPKKYKIVIKNNLKQTSIFI